MKVGAVPEWLKVVLSALRKEILIPEGGPEGDISVHHSPPLHHTSVLRSALGAAAPEAPWGQTVPPTAAARQLSGHTLPPFLATLGPWPHLAPLQIVIQTHLWGI